MNNFLILPELQRRNVFSAIAHKVGLPAQIVEKDFWVTAVLNILFHSPLSEHLVFKGGTSLSKGWKLIERFSEDVDLAVNPFLTLTPILRVRCYCSDCQGGKIF